MKMSCIEFSSDMQSYVHSTAQISLCSTGLSNSKEKLQKVSDLVDTELHADTKGPGSSYLRSQLQLC
jgi:hypothetical protein